jgi:hypothetical protein
VTSSFGHGNEQLDSITYREIFEYLKDWWLLKEESLSNVSYSFLFTLDMHKHLYMKRNCTDVENTRTDL